MKTKQLLLIAALFVGSTLTVSAQTLILSEDFSTPEWQAELLRLNPGADEFGIPINTNAPNLNPYAPVSPADGTNKNASYNNLNVTDRYFDKYILNGDIETIAGIGSDVCAADGGNHNVLIPAGFYEGQMLPVGFRMFKTTGFLELPEIASADSIILHIRGGNNDKTTQLTLQKWESDAWVTITNLPVLNRGAFFNNNVDEIIKHEIKSSTPIKLRIAHLDTQPFFQIYQIDIQEYIPSGVIIPEAAGFKQIGRKLVVGEPTKIAIYNTVGSLMFEKQVTGQLEIPATLGSGIFMVKTDKGSQKIFLD
jgi:hypothetical protein